MKLVGQPIISRNEAERVAKIGAAVRKFLAEWLALFGAGVRWSDGVERELCKVFLEYACLVRLSRDELGTDEQNVVDVESCAKELLEVVERRLGS
jgi:hypothetical protein